MKNKIAVISDIHSNADALTKILDELNKEKADTTIFLGDILTYGCQPLEVLDMLVEYKRKNSIIFIKGNHDQFYFDLQSNSKNTSYKLPFFIEESVTWTLKKISPYLLKDTFEWHNSYRIGDIYFSHANPFSYGDWSYIEKPENLHKSFLELLKKDVFAGIFGHTHRQLFIGNKNNILNKMDSYSAELDKIDQLIINSGTVGQPRGSGVGYTLLVLKNDKLHNANFKKINMDFGNTIELIQKTEFSKETKKKLIDFLET